MIRGFVWVTFLVGVLGAVAPAHADWPPEGIQLGGGTQVLDLDLASDESGGVVTLWRQRGPGQLDYKARAVRVSGTGSVPPGWDWSESSLFTSARDSYAFQDGLGGAFLLYHGQPGDTTWKLLHIPPGGGLDPAWPAAGTAVARAFPSSPHIYPCAVSDGAGGALVAFVPHNASGNPGTSVRVRHVLANGALDPGWPAGGRPLGPYSDVYSPVLGGMPDGAGGGIIVWLAPEARAQRVTGAGTIASGWPANGLVLRNVPFTPTGEELPLLAVVPSGPDHFFVAWNDEGSGGRSLWLQRLHRDGTLASGWPASAMQVHTYSSYSTRNARLIGDGTTGAYLAWIDGWTDGLNRLRGVRILEDGSIASGWGATGGHLLTDLAARMSTSVPSCDVASAEASRLIVTWRDTRNPGNPRLRTRWMLADGSADPFQPDSGRALTPSNARPEMPATRSDGQGGVYVGWVNDESISESAKLSWVPYDPSLVGVGRNPPPRTVALRAWPNPARGALEVEFTLATGARARLELLDVSGRRVRSLDVQGAGPHVAKLTGLRGVAPGVYLLSLEQEGTFRTTRVALIH